MCYNSRMKNVWIFSVILVCAGCLSRPRTAFHETASSASASGTVNLWPFYLDAGKSKHAAWPLVKWSPGSFAFLPFYNYDHGIQDFMLLASMDLEREEYRLFPLFYATKNGSGVPLLFHRHDKLTHILCGGVYPEGWYAFPLVWWERAPHRTRLLTPLFSYKNEAYGTRQTSEWSSLLYLAGWRERPSFDLAKNERERKAWLFPLWWRWSELTAGRETSIGSLFLPFFYHGRHPNDNAVDFATPLFGFGKDPSRDAHWWYALNCGAVSKPRTQESHASRAWALPFWFSSTDDVAKRRTDWTPLSYHRAWPNDLTVNAGLFGMPFPYHYRKTPERETLRVFPFGARETAWYRSGVSAGNPTGTLLGKRSESRAFGGGLLGSWTRYYDLPRDAKLAPADKIWAREGFELSALAGLFGYGNERGWEFTTAETLPLHATAPAKSETTTLNLGWFLWRQRFGKSNGVDDSYSLWTPLVSWSVSDLPSRKYGCLFDFFSFKTYQNDSHASVGYTWLWKSHTYADRSRCERELLSGLLYDHRLSAGYEHTSGGGHERHLSGGFKKGSILGGLLMGYSYRDERTWRWTRENPNDKKLVRDEFHDDFYVLTPLVYSSRGTSRAGSVSRRLFGGVLCHQNKDCEKGTDSFSILGYLYRRNRFADGSREQLIFPFIRTAANDAKKTWSFSIFHKLFRLDHSPSGSDWTFLWM